MHIVQREAVYSAFQALPPTKSTRNEQFHAHAPLYPPLCCVAALQGQYIYIYIVFANMNRELLAQGCHAVSALLHGLYGLNLKWEQHSDFVAWGVAEVVQPTSISLCKKGVVRPLHDKLVGQEWERWVPSNSTNARFTMGSVLPTLYNNSTWYAASQSDVITNFRSLCWGLGFGLYPTGRWLSGMSRFIAAHGLVKIMPMHVLRQ